MLFPASASVNAVRFYSGGPLPLAWFAFAPKQHLMSFVSFVPLLHCLLDHLFQHCLQMPLPALQAVQQMRLRSSDKKQPLWRSSWGRWRWGRWAVWTPCWLLRLGGWRCGCRGWRWWSGWPGTSTTASRSSGCSSASRGPQESLTWGTGWSKSWRERADPFSRCHVVARCSRTPSISGWRQLQMGGGERQRSSREGRQGCRIVARIKMGIDLFRSKSRLGSILTSRIEHFEIFELNYFATFWKFFWRFFFSIFFCRIVKSEHCSGAPSKFRWPNILYLMIRQIYMIKKPLRPHANNFDLAITRMCSHEAFIIYCLNS